MFNLSSCPTRGGKSCLSAPTDQQVSLSACPSAFGSSATAAFCRLFRCLHICEYKFVSLLVFFFVFLPQSGQRGSLQCRSEATLHNRYSFKTSEGSLRGKPALFSPPPSQISRPLHISTRPEESGFIFNVFCDASDHLMARAARECDGQVCRGRSRVGGDGCRCCCCLP